jgi:hypothetical protein
VHLAVHAASLAVRCGWCHADDAPVVPCARCGATLHPACRAEARRCPTLGCPRPTAPAALRRLEVPWGLLLWLQVLTVLWVELIVLGTLVSALHRREQPLSPSALALITVGLSARSAIGAAVWSLAALGGAVGWRRGLRAMVVIATGLVVGLGLGAACLACSTLLPHVRS